MIKVLEVIDSLCAGGAESLLKNFLIESKKYPDFQIDVCTLYSRNIFKDELVNNGVTVYDLSLPFKYDFRGVFKIVRLINSNNYDIIHVHLFPADIFAAIASLFTKKRTKFVFSEHSVFNRRRSNKIFKRIDNFTYSRYAKIVCVSEKVKESLIGWISEIAHKMVVIRNAVPVGKMGDKKESVYDILFVGRLERAKGVDVLFEAIKLLETKYDRKLKVAIIGDGSLNEELKGIAERLNISESVEFLGVRKDISDLMRKSKIFVLPSRWEGLPMVILEAMALGMPVVATKVGGIPEVIEDGKDGILVEPENPERLANSIFRLLDDDGLRSLFSSNAYRKIKEEYSIEKYTKTLLGLYKELVE